MEYNLIAISDSLSISQETLRAFAKGELDHATEERIIALLETRPDLAAQIAAISSDPILERMRENSQMAAKQSLSGHIGTKPTDQQQTELQQHHPSVVPNELAELSEFKILKEIGRGGMGVVYLAEHRLTGRREVLKVLNERLISNSEARKRFDQEIKCIAAMNHETIVQCYTVMQLPYSLVLCMEYVAGTNLQRFISNNGPLPIHVACGIASEVCRGLQHAMDNGLVHRDIKPSNIMLYKKDGKIKVKILDFGLARFSSREESNEAIGQRGLTGDGTLLGTLEYISPEQCLNASEADIRSDIYSLGCTLYHMLVGYPPFSGSAGELVIAHAQAVPPAIHLIRPEIPAELAALVSRMLAKTPSRRFASPVDVGRELKPFLSRRQGKESQPNCSDLHLEAYDCSNLEDLLAPIENTDTAVNLDASAETLRTAVPSRSESTDSQEPIQGDHEVLSDYTAKSQDTFPCESQLQQTHHARIKRPWIHQAALLVIPVILIVSGLTGLLLITAPKTIIAIPNLPENSIIQIDGEEVIVRRDDSHTIAAAEPGNREIKVSVDGVVVYNSIVKIDKGKKNEVLVELNELPDEQPGIEHAVPDTGRWISLFDGTQASFDQHWNIAPESRASRISTNEERELTIACGSGDDNFATFNSKEMFGPNLHVSLSYKSGNGSPKVFTYAFCKADFDRWNHYSVTLGGFHETGPSSPILGVGSINIGYVRQPGRNFNESAKKVKLEYGQLCHMEILCFQGRSVIKVDGQIVNDVKAPDTPMLPRNLQFWTTRGSLINFQSIKVKNNISESEFLESLKTSP